MEKVEVMEGAKKGTIITDLTMVTEDRMVNMVLRIHEKRVQSLLEVRCI